ncbi:hypothetical protein D3C76_1410510 [compost metagenome]
MALHAKRAQEQARAAIEQPGQGLQQLERHLEQAVAQANEGLRVTSGQLPWQVLGDDQQQRCGTQARQPEAVFAAVALADQAGQGQHQQLAQGRAQHQGLGGNGKVGVCAGLGVAPRTIELLLGGVHRSE